MCLVEGYDQNRLASAAESGQSVILGSRDGHICGIDDVGHVVDRLAQILRGRALNLNQDTLPIGLESWAQLEQEIVERSRLSWPCLGTHDSRTVFANDLQKVQFADLCSFVDQADIGLVVDL